ncbi:MAG: endo-1,4-beta-xylanase [Verrucomicrobiota bacterium]
MNMKRIAVCIPALAASAVCLVAGPVPNEVYQKLWNDPAVSRRIEDGIRTNRMSEVVLKFAGTNGQFMSNVTVQVEQTRHEFLFGANSFMLGGFPTPAQNRQYETAFLSLLNYATVPFYWSDLEPEPGKPRFAKDSPPIYRRPPPDAVVEFCRQHGLAMKGHPLVWHQWYPKWRPDDPQDAMTRIEQRITEIAARYGGTIPRWEVVNEPMERQKYADKWCNLPEGYVLRSLHVAAKTFPAETRLMLNEATTFSWLEFQGKKSPYYQLIREMIEGGARVDEIGLQLHIFSEQAWQRSQAGKQFTPTDLFQVLDQYSDFQRPLHITEITIPALPDGPDGERDQAIVARNFYRLWFSHPRVEAITWWNLVDGTAAKGEDKWHAGLLHQDFSPKPAFTALDQLINHDWRTVFNTNSAGCNEVAFRGFHGEYNVTAKSGGNTVKQTFRLQKGAPNEWIIKF